MADCAMIPSFFYALWLTEKLGCDPLLDDKPTLKMWWQHRNQIPAVVRVLDEVEVGLNKFLSSIPKQK